ncbi:MAG: hypothetical protein LBJ13_02520 [Puniceicoccales bacterium]|jgi:hypothetical protein|nr:hypothetical protein [Puniceicoccales bacterium]
MDVNVVGGRLVDQAMTVGGGRFPSNVILVDDGVLPAFGRSKEFQNVLGSNVVDLTVNSVKHAGFWKHKSIERVTPGEGVYNTAQEMRDAYNNIINSIDQLMANKDGSNFTTADLLTLQMYVMQLAFINEVSSKVADKTGQCAQTLFRNQG